MMVDSLSAKKWAPDMLERLCTCSCGKVFQMGDGFVYPLNFEKEGVVMLAVHAYCSTKCLCENEPPCTDLPQ
jgi:hypothetical protein